MPLRIPFWAPDVLRNYLESKEKEVVTIMMSLFDEEQIMKIYVKDSKRPIMGTPT
jgi:hypothetical protein